MNVVLIIPTGLDAEIGGNAGDANPVAKLIASVSDKLITHPNVVNAADINEMPPNTLYVEGSILDRFLEGTTELKEVRSNKILVAVNSPVKPETVNAVSASRVTLGADIEIVELKTPFLMKSIIERGIAKGEVTGVDELVKQVSEYEFDALALATPIYVDKEVGLNYLRNGGTNPWGGVEAIASKAVANKVNKPVAHAPVETEDDKWFQNYNEVTDLTIAPEMITTSFLHCVLKGLHKAPRPVKAGYGTISNRDVDVMISPYGCWGRPHEACVKANIPIIIVKNNKVISSNIDHIGHLYVNHDNLIYVENYLEAVGIIQAMKQGISKEYFFRPIEPTKVKGVPIQKDQRQQ